MKLFARKDDLVVPIEDRTALYESVQAEVEAEPPIEIAPLPAYDHDAACPKCRFTAGTTLFQRGYHEHCPIPETPWRPFSLIGFGWTPSRDQLLEQERYYKACRAIPEHFDRECPNCKHRWAEAVA